jgi:predicted glycosyltransferase
MAKPSWLIVPESMTDAETTYPGLKIRKYPGIKENVYVPYFKPDITLSKTLGLNEQDIVVTVRPPANEAHYHNPASDVLFNSLMDELIHTDLVRVVLLPRNKNQQSELIQKRPEWFSNGKIVIPSKAIDGLNLIWNSDLVVSGGGTMNREAAALNVPVYSIFRGPIGDIDKFLQASGKLTLIETVEEIRSKIDIKKRQRTTNSQSTSNKTLESILQHIDEILCL